MIKPIHTTKYLSIKDYLEYQNIEDNNWEELNKFFKAHDLPTTEDIKNENLRMYIWGGVPVEIYDMNQIKKSESSEVLDLK